MSPSTSDTAPPLYGRKSSNEEKYDISMGNRLRHHLPVENDFWFTIGAYFWATSIVLGGHSLPDRCKCEIQSI